MASLLLFTLILGQHAEISIANPLAMQDSMEYCSGVPKIKIHPTLLGKLTWTLHDNRGKWQVFR